jgi:predicted lipoprotein with Yx(FWY)xxD motif
LYEPVGVLLCNRLTRAAPKEDTMSHTITGRRTLRRQLLATLAAAATLTLVTACSSSTATPAAPPAAATTSAPAPAASTAASTSASNVTELKTMTSSLGNIVTDGKGMVLYAYLKDTQGTQAGACTGGCAAAWPMALASSTPTLTGVTGAVTMIPAASGGKQLALNGWPLYYFAKDKAAGDILGQGIGSVWYVLDASGTPKKA